jgi:hypothetical protein
MQQSKASLPTIQIPYVCALVRIMEREIATGIGIVLRLGES